MKMRNAECGVGNEKEGIVAWVQEGSPSYGGLKARSRAFALRIIRLVESLPRQIVVGVLGRQLVRSGTSVGANYRAACRAKSKRDFIAKLGIVEEECDESIYWMELLVEGNYVEPHLLADLLNEANQLLAIMVASINTAKAKPTKPS